MAETRIRTAIQAEFQCGRLKGKGRITNVGEGGLFLGTPASVPEQGETVRVHFRAPGCRQIVVKGLVWWTTDGRQRRSRMRGFGLRLLDENPEFQNVVQGLRR